MTIDELLPRLIVAPHESAKKMLKDFIRQERSADQLVIAELREKADQLWRRNVELEQERR